MFNIIFTDVFLPKQIFRNYRFTFSLSVNVNIILSTKNEIHPDFRPVAFQIKHRILYISIKGVFFQGGKLNRLWIW